MPIPEIMIRSADLTPQTANPETRSVEVIWSTGAGVRRRDRMGDYIERLSLEPSAVDLSRLIGASVLDAHRQGAVRDVLGTVRQAAVDGRQGKATLQFSSRAEVEPVWQDVLGGILRHVSVGYTVEDWQEGTEGDIRTLTATRWTPIEISLVPTPADPGATIRKEEPLMPESTPAASDKTTRAAVNTEIRSIARVAGLDQTFIDGLIDRNATADEARREAFAALAKRGGTIRTEQTRVEIVESHDEPEKRARQMGEALYARINPQHQLSEPARRYAYSSCADMAREILMLRGAPVLGLSPAGVITRALHTTSDFSLIVGETINRILRQAYQAAPAGVRFLGRQTTAKDFRNVNKIMLGEAPLLEKLGESGEIKSGTMAESREAYRIQTFAKKIGISRQVLVNDDLGAFADLARRMGLAAAETEALTLVGLLESGGNGPVMEDGNALFHTAHGNKAASGGVIADTTLSDARLAMRSQKGLSGQLVSSTPKFLLVPSALETTAEKWLATVAATQALDVNPFSGALQLVVEPRLTDPERWYVVADPKEMDGLEYAYLAGGEGPQAGIGCAQVEQQGTVI